MHIHIYVCMYIYIYICIIWLAIADGMGDSPVIELSNNFMLLIVVC